MVYRICAVNAHKIESFTKRVTGLIKIPYLCFVLIPHFNDSKYKDYVQTYQSNRLKCFLRSFEMP